MFHALFVLAALSALQCSGRNSLHWGLFRVTKQVPFCSVYYPFNRDTESLRSCIFVCISFSPLTLLTWAWQAQSRSWSFNSISGRWMSGHERVRGRQGTRPTASTKVLKVFSERRELPVLYHCFGGFLWHCHSPTCSHANHFAAWLACIQSHT